MIRDFDTVNDIFSNLTPAQYKMTEIAANAYYSVGDGSMLAQASADTGLTPEEILVLW